jgi:GT2 family glycosyltransferase
MTEATTLGIVIIGRNEGERLVGCLNSLQDSAAPVVYVDSGSTDGSIEAAERSGATVVLLPQDQPFTAGRARNLGFRSLTELHPELEWVQFVDGDCQVADDWLSFARNYLQTHPADAIVCGRRKEMHPEQSLYNRMCDFEWNTPVGEADACGGDFMVVAKAFVDIDGFNNRLIAGEEPELCFRLRQQGWKIYRADKMMTHHDAAMTHFGQWLRRTTRAGYAYAARAALHRHVPGGFCRRENLRIFFWAAALPLAILAAAALVSGWFSLILLAYPAQYLKLWIWVRRSDPEMPAPRFALLLLIGKWPEFGGQLIFLSRWLRGAEQTLIEYK